MLVDKMLVDEMLVDEINTQALIFTDEKGAARFTRLDSDEVGGSSFRRVDQRTADRQDRFAKVADSTVQ